MNGMRLLAALIAGALTMRVVAQEPPWNAAAIKECDRACLVGILDNYLNAIFKKDRVEAAPFVTIPYGLGNGWTPGSGR